MGSLFAPEAWDDRGRAVTVLRASELRGDEGSVAERKKLIRRLRAGIASSSQTHWLPQVVAIGLVLSGCFVGALVARWMGRMWMVAVLAVFSASAGFAARAVSRARMAPQIAASAVAEGFCGSCAQSLRGLVVEEDGCLCCAECGAAWKQLRITSAHWEERTEYEKKVRFRGGGGFAMGRASSREMVSDDRGRFIRSASGWVWRLPRETREALGPEGRARVYQALRRVGVASRVVAVCFVGVLLGVPGLLMIVLPRPFGALETVLGLVVLGFAIVLCALLWFVNPGRADKRVKALVGEGVCGGCGGIIGGLKAETDGCIVCPNCRAAWRVAPPVQP